MCIHISTFKCVFISLLEIKSFVSLKNESLFFVFIGRGYISKGRGGELGGGGGHVLQNFEGGRVEVVLGFTESCTACQQPFWNISAKSFKKVSVRVNY